MQATGKIAVITGAGSGIGRASALALYAEGFSVVLAGRRRNMLEETAALAQASPPRMLVVPTDVSDPASIAALFETVQATYRRIDLLFNNAGISTRNIPIDDLTYEQWSNVVAVNLTGSFLCAQHAFRMMKAQEPKGAFYAYPNVSAAFRDGISNSFEFSEKLLAEEHVAVVPGEAFGTNDHIRLSYATSIKELERGLDRIERFIAARV